MKDLSDLDLPRRTCIEAEFDERHWDLYRPTTVRQYFHLCARELFSYEEWLLVVIHPIQLEGFM